MSAQDITAGGVNDRVEAIETAQTIAGVGTHRTAGRLVLVLIGLVIGLSCGEIITRAFRLGHINPIIRYNDRILKLRPHIKFMNYLENPNLVETNNLGFHDHEREATNDKYRVLFIGDSFVEGRQVPTDSLFTIRLEKK